MKKLFLKSLLFFDWFHLIFFVTVLDIWLLFLPTAFADIGRSTPAYSEESTEVDTLVKPRGQISGSVLRQYFMMEDPGQAANALRAYVVENNISLGQSISSLRTLSAMAQNVSKAERAKKNNIIHVFNGNEFTPKAGVEDALLVRVQKMIEEPESEEKIVCILQIHGKITLAEVIELLEAGVKVYDSVGQNAVIVRLPVSAVSSLSSRPYIRWIGEYKPEYKYKKLRGVIYPLGGDRPEYRVDLEQLGIEIRKYDNKSNGYEVLLNDVAINKIAESFWWVKGIHLEGTGAYEDECQLRANKHCSLLPEHPELFHLEPIRVPTKGNDQTEEERVYCNYVVYSIIGFCSKIRILFLERSVK